MGVREARRGLIVFPFERISLFGESGLPEARQETHRK